MAVSKGNSGVLQTSATSGGTYVSVGSLVSWSLETTGESIETTAMGATKFKTFTAGNYGWSGSADCLWEDDDATQEALFATLQASTNYFVKLYPIGTSAGDYWSGEIVVTSVSESGAIDDTIKYSLSFQGTGALTLNNA